MLFFSTYTSAVEHQAHNSKEYNTEQEVASLAESSKESVFEIYCIEESPPLAEPARNAINTPATAPPATRPVANRFPFPSSSSSPSIAGPFFFSTNPRIAPPINIGSVVDNGRYAPTAKLKDLMPQSSMTNARNIPTNTYCQSRF